MPISTPTGVIAAKVVTDPTVNSHTLFWLCTVATLIITIGCIGYAYEKQKKMVPVFISALVSNYILISSFYAIMEVGKPKTLWEVLDGSAFFGLSVLLKTIFAFIILALVRLMLHPENLNEFVAKVFNIEISFKQHVDNALGNFEDAKKQMANISAINEAQVELISSTFENPILDSTNVAAEIRLTVKNVLFSIYDSASKVIVHVIPFQEQPIDGLGDEIAALVRLNYKKEGDICKIYHNKIGIGIYHSEANDEGAIIVLDARNADYPLTLGELNAASNLYISISSIITFAGDSRDLRTAISQFQRNGGLN